VVDEASDLVAEASDLVSDSNIRMEKIGTQEREREREREGKYVLSEFSENVALYLLLS